MADETPPRPPATPARSSFDRKLYARSGETIELGGKALFGVNFLRVFTREGQVVLKLVWPDLAFSIFLLVLAFLVTAYGIYLQAEADR